MNLRSYAKRQLNPFAGTLQIVESDSARAFSANGVLWRIQTIANRPEHTWRSAAQMPSLRQYFNWGLWSAELGLQRVSANPLLDIGAMASAADKLVAALPDEMKKMPFEPLDHFELWGCDARGKPMALLASATSPADRQKLPSCEWRAGNRDDQDFVSPALLDAGIENPAGPSSTTHTEYLETGVRRRIREQTWYQRHPDGHGTRHDLQARLERQAFPELGLALDWGEQRLNAAVHDYLSWTAPLLLTLSSLSHKLRERLERQAMQRATLVADLHRLYPVVINPALIEQARVESRLRRSM